MCSMKYGIWSDSFVHTYLFFHCGHCRELNSCYMPLQCGAGTLPKKHDHFLIPCHTSCEFPSVFPVPLYARLSSSLSLFLSISCLIHLFPSLEHSFPPSLHLSPLHFHFPLPHFCPLSLSADSLQWCTGCLDSIPSPLTPHLLSGCPTLMSRTL